MNQETRGGPPSSPSFMSAPGPYISGLRAGIYIFTDALAYMVPYRRWSLLSVWQLKWQKWCELLIDCRYATLALLKELHVCIISPEGDMPWTVDWPGQSENEDVD